MKIAKYWKAGKRRMECQTWVKELHHVFDKVAHSCPASCCFPEAYIILACLMFCIISYADVSPSSQNGAISDIKDGKLWHKPFFSIELPEFSKHTLEVLRQPLEDRVITISRARYSVEYPCNFQFVESMNPCPCGYYGDPTHNCVCTPGQIQKYLNKKSGLHNTRPHRYTVRDDLNPVFRTF